MSLKLTPQRQEHLTGIFAEGAAGASRALSQWLGRPLSLAVTAVELVPLEGVADLLGPAETVIAACSMTLQGRMTGTILLIFRDQVGLEMVDLLIGRPLGTTTQWGELEQSAARETTNIVGCAYLSALARHLPELGFFATEVDASVHGLLPSPPVFFHDFAGSVIELALLERSLELDQVLLIETHFARDQQPVTTSGSEPLEWTLLFLPGRETLEVLTAPGESQHP